MDTAHLSSFTLSVPQHHAPCVVAIALYFYLVFVPCAGVDTPESSIHEYIMIVRRY